MIRNFLLMIGLMLALQSAALETASAREHKPQNLRLTVTTVVNPDMDPQYLYVINDLLAFESLDKLKDYLAARPKNSRLTWENPGNRLGLQPLGSPDDMKDFEAFCQAHGIRFTEVRSG